MVMRKSGLLPVVGARLLGRSRGSPVVGEPREMKRIVWVAGVAMTIAGTAILSGCAPVAAVGAGAAVGAVAAQEFGGPMSPEDAAIRNAIIEEWESTDADMASRLSVAVSEGRALVTGRISNPNQRIEAIRAVWDEPRIVEVINEVEIAEDAGLAQAARDRWIAAQLRSRLTVDSAIRAINYSIDVVDGVVYLMGDTVSDDERDRVVNNARQIAYVARVVDYISVRDGAGTGA